jgi:Holliday junction DNA helicase RuvA
MYASLNGPVVAINETTAVLECSGVGYLCHCPSRTLAALQVGKPARLWVHLAVREEALTLFGFLEVAEKDFFLALTNVSGVGPKIGLSLLSYFTPTEITTAIASNQPSHLARASGVGKKLAEKIIVELKDKLGSLPILAASGVIGAQVQGPFSEVASALQNLGYSPKVAETAAQKALEASPDAAFDTLFKTALKHATTA